MGARIETATLLSRVNDAVDCTVYIESVTQIGDTDIYTISTWNTKWIGINRNVTISGEEYLVKDIVANTSFNIQVATGQPVPSTSSFTIEKPYFFKGTFAFTDNERIQVLDSVNKTPFVFYHEPTSKDRNVNDPLSAIDRFSDCELYKLMDANYDDWTQEQHYNYSIMAAGNYFYEFIKALRNCSFVSELTEDYTSENHVKFGTYIDSKGHDKNLFSENLSGKKNSITIPFMKQFGCEDLYTPPSNGSVDVVINVDGVEYYSETITEDTTINIEFE